MQLATKLLQRSASPALAAAFAALALAAGSAAAQTYPDKPVKIISPFSAGGPADIYARYLAQRLEKPLGQPLVVENRVGGGGIIGADAVAKAAPDGYTLLVMSNTHTVNESLVAKKPYKLMTDLRAGRAAQLLRPAAGGASVGTGERSAKELIALAKSKPGELNYASSGPGTPYHMAGELFKSMAGLDIVHVPHKEKLGSADERDGRPGPDDVRRDHRDVEAGRVRQGPGHRLERQHALGGDAGGADRRGGRRARLRRDDLAGNHGAGRYAEAGRRSAQRRDPKILAQAEVKADFAKQGAVPMQMSPDEFGRFLAQDIEKWAKVVKVSGAKVD